MLNAFRLAGDFCHIFAMLMLLFSIFIRKSCHGVSGKSQVLFFMVYIARYLDLFTTYISFYNYSFKVSYILISLFTCFLIHAVHMKTYQRTYDTIMTEITVFMAFATAIFMNYQMNPIEIMWTFSEYLESVALLPQFFFIINTRKVTYQMLVYLGAMGAYKGFYALNWIYRYNTENSIDVISDVAGLMFIGLFLLFSLTMLCGGIEIEKGQNFIKKNIFFISQNKIIPQTDIEKDELLTTK